MSRKNSKMGGFTWTEILIVIVLLAFFTFIAAVLMPRNYVRHGQTSPINACINNLRIIDGSKGAWALENHKEISDTASASEIQPYMGHGSASVLPICPADPKHTFETSYSMNNVGSKPTCKINPTLHSLP